MNQFFSNLRTHISQRWVFALMCFFGLAHAFAMRTCLSITLTEMVYLNKSNTRHDDSCPTVDFPNVTLSKITRSSKKIFHWSEETQGLILSSFYCGNVISHLPAGFIADKYGGKHIYGLGILMSAFFTIITPYLLTWAESGLIFSRVFIGFAQGVLYPSINVLLSQWAPAQERSRIGTFVFAGASIGIIYANGASGYILHHTDNTSYVFYFFGGISCVWYIFWLILGYNSPKENPFISKSELDYLSEHLSDNSREKLPPIPWRHILKSKAVWAVTVGLLGFDWLTLTIISDLPKYLSSVLKFQVQDNGYVNSLMYLSMWIISILTSWMSDLAIERRIMSTTAVRKIGSLLSLFIPACFAAGASYAGCNQLLVIIMFTITMGLTGGAYPSVMVNTLDLSPNYSGVLMAITSVISSGIAGILSPYIVGIVTPHQTLSEWRIVFWILFAVSTVTNLVFLLFGSGEIQYWNDLKLAVVDLHFHLDK